MNLNILKLVYWPTDIPIIKKFHDRLGFVKKKKREPRNEYGMFRATLHDVLLEVSVVSLGLRC